MPLSSGNQNFPADQTPPINTLLTLYKFVKFAFSFWAGEYNYNYDYIPSLAMTTSPPLPLINLNIPSQELPNIKWVTLVIQQITILKANKARHFENSCPITQAENGKQNSAIINAVPLPNRSLSFS
jgi:hypothetical protein